MAGPLDDAALAALGQVEFGYTRELESIWADSADHVRQLNGDVLGRLVAEFLRRTRPEATTRPIGWALIGQAGAGKTHLLGALRREVWESGGWFVLLDLLDVNDFWATAALGFVDSLMRPMPGGTSQGRAVLHRLCERFGLSPELAARLTGPGRDRPDAGASRDASALRRGMARLGSLFSRRSAAAVGWASWELAAQDFLAALQRAEPLGAGGHRDAVMGFLALVAGNPVRQDFGRAWLTGSDVEATGKEILQVLRAAIPPRKAIEGLSWLMSLAGPTVCALDQIDPIVSVAHATAGVGGPGNDPAQNRALAVIDELAGGLMDLRDVTRRTVTVVSTLEATWQTLCQRAVASFRDRFDTVRLRNIGGAEAARSLVEKRLAVAYAEAGFMPPYPSWPFRPEAFEGVTQFTPRQLLQACRDHIETCLDSGATGELAAFPGTLPGLPATPPAKSAPVAPSPPSSAIEQRYAELCAAPSPAGAPDPDSDEDAAADLLIAALTAFARQTVLPATQDLVVEHDTPGLHARLRRIDNANGGQEEHHCFRAIPQTNAIAMQGRLQAAITASGIDRALSFRHLIVLRRGAWPSGPRSAALVRQFELRKGRVLTPDAQDWSRFAALRTLLGEAPTGLDKWLQTRRPLGESPFFQAVGLAGDGLAPIPADPPDDPAPVIAPGPLSPDTPPLPTAADAIPLGVRAGDRQTVWLKLDMLRRHVAVIAGAGSGKTVLLRRMVEEAALAGVPSILLDSNNDLVRIADPWPERPAEFTDEDAAKAARFARKADVVVWTPGRARGNPLTLAPLPDFAALTDEEERNDAVGMAAATLEKLIGAGGQRGQLKAGVLSGALRHFARAGGGRLQDLVALLRDFPSNVSEISNAPRLAGDIADALIAAIERNPLLDGAGARLDPAVLFGGPPGRVRVSVVNLAGLPGDEARQDFVGRLLMALFGHIRRHPAGPDRPVAGLLVMDEAQNFASSDRNTPSGAAAVALVRQARKYGLGMLFATQEPRAIDHRIIANCTTQMFGLTNSPASLSAVRGMLASRGGGGEELGRLPRGQFYLTTEGERPQKLTAPLCLTYHPASPPSEDDVIERAARARAGA